MDPIIVYLWLNKYDKVNKNINKKKIEYNFEYYLWWYL